MKAYVLLAALGAASMALAVLVIVDGFNGYRP